MSPSWFCRHLFSLKLSPFSLTFRNTHAQPFTELKSVCKLTVSRHLWYESTHGHLNAFLQHLLLGQSRCASSSLNIYRFRPGLAHVWKPMMFNYRVIKGLSTVTLVYRGQLPSYWSGKPTWLSHMNVSREISPVQGESLGNKIPPCHPRYLSPIPNPFPSNQLWIPFFLSPPAPCAFHFLSSLRSWTVEGVGRERRENDAD